MENLYNELSSAKELFLFAGPCVIESKECIFEIASELKKITEELKMPFVFKASFDKANRTSINSYRGPGLEKGLEILSDVKEKYKVPIITDIHIPEQAKIVSEVVDILQIPAFLCRQTDLIVEAAKTGVPINIKKAQFAAPADMKNVINKAYEAGNKELFLCERGTTFGYNNLVVDMTGIVEMKKNDIPIVFDATHSVQKPGGNGTSTGGNREYVKYLSRAAVAVGADGLFMETHPNPDIALSDGPNMIPLAKVKKLLIELKSLRKTINTFEE